MLKENMHIHSKYSWDCVKYGKMEIAEIAKILYENGIRYGAITDHVEFDREPLPYVLTSLKVRNLEIDRVNEIYDGKVTLLKAVEISSPHLYIDKVKALEELDLDFLMGSIHKMIRNAKTPTDKIHASYLYYSELLKMIESQTVDVIGHIDYINRYYDKDYSFAYQISDIMKAISENHQIMEINTSAARRIDKDTFPSLEKICIYKLSGNNEVTIGTDAHQYSELTDNLDNIDKIINTLDLKPVIYQKRKRIII